MQQLRTAYEPWTDRRRRTGQLRERHPFAAEVLQLYSALLDVQQGAFNDAREAPPPAAELASYISVRVLPRVLEATVATGPEKLSAAVVGRFHGADLEDLVRRWLRSEEQPLVDRYLARAASAPVLEAGGETLALACTGPRDQRHCPHCGGLPQLGYFALSGEPLVTGPRYLVCGRCHAAWSYPRMVCAGCGETDSRRMVVYSEKEHLPNLRIDGCESCQRYLISVDLRADAAAVPLVDELAALPLDLYAKDRGMTKVLPNLMGF